MSTCEDCFDMSLMIKFAIDGIGWDQESIFSSIAHAVDSLSTRSSSSVSILVNPSDTLRCGS